MATQELNELLTEQATFYISEGPATLVSLEKYPHIYLVEETEPVFFD